MQFHQYEDLKGKSTDLSERYLEFLRVPNISMGLYTLKVGEEDLQTAHNEDEVYYLIEGRAKIVVEEVKRSLEPGSIIYVPAFADHKFVDILEDLRLLVFFSPAES